MRRIDKQISDQSIIEEILANSELCRLGLIENDEVYIVPVNYGYKDGVIYIHSALEGRKMNILRQNKAVSFEITQSSEIITHSQVCNWGTRYRSVMGTGTIHIETQSDEKAKALDVIMTKYGATNPSYNPDVLARVAVLVLKINTLTAKQSGKWE